MTAPLPPDSDARLAALEEAVAALRAEVASLRATPPAAATPSVAPVAHARAAAPATYADVPPAPRTQAPGPAARLGAATRTWATGLGLPEFPTERADLETLIGRYGAVAVGALVLLMGVGAFLTWAVANFTLAPATRVVLGAIGAAALATLGEWLRRRPGAQRFGEVLLALALAVLHVDAWAAGPYLHLVSAPAALGAAAAASGALTALAWRARQQSLFVVGVGGALLAPFVSGAGDVEPFVRPIYGWLVLGAGLIALVHGSEARRPWRAASRLLALGTSLYALAQLDAGLGVRAAAGTADRWLRPAAFVPDLPAAFTLACAATSLAALVWARRTGATGQATAASPDPAAPTGSDAPAVRALLVELTLAQLTTATVVLWATAAATLHERPTLFGCALLTLIGAQLVAVLATPEPATLPATARPARRGRGLPVAALAGLVLPLGTLAAALAGLDRLGTPAAALTALLWSGISGLAAFAGWRRATDREPDVQFGPHLAAAGIAGALALVLWTREHDALRLALLGIYGALSSLLFARLPRTTRADAGQTGTRTRDRRPLLALAPPLLTLTGASLWGAVLLHARPTPTPRS